MTDQDWSSACIIALIMVLIVLCVVPGTARIRVSTIAGYWVTPSGEYYYIGKGPTSRTFIIRSENEPSGDTKGHLSGLRSLRRRDAEGNLIRGTVEIGDRQIQWNNGDTWFLQGISREIWW